MRGWGLGALRTDRQRRLSDTLFLTVRNSLQFRPPPPVTREGLQEYELSFRVTGAPCPFETLERLGAALIGLG
jgi:hypothetical protein